MRILISGCSGGGKSTLISEMAARGYPTVEEPGRRLVREGVSPWDAPEEFLRRALEMALAEFQSAKPHDKPTLFDRGFLDAAAAMERMGSESGYVRDILLTHRYDTTVYLTPPWPEIFVSDTERQHGLSQAREEYDHLKLFLPRHGYTAVDIPKLPVADRANWLEAELGWK